MFGSYPKSKGGQVEAGYPSAFVVDTHATRPPVPPRLSQDGRRSGAVQTLLFLLVSLALCGMIIEACFIYHLYQVEQVSSAPSSSKLIGGDDASPTTYPWEDYQPSKPVAHLTDGVDIIHDKHVMDWSMNADPILYEMEYKDRSLIIQNEGYYFIYSKVHFTYNGNFQHFVNLRTEKYAGGFITLLQSREYSPESSKMRSNSYVGGVFHLFKNDAIYVNVSSTKKIIRHKSSENVFGAYMI